MTLAVGGDLHLGTRIGGKGRLVMLGRSRGDTLLFLLVMVVGLDGDLAAARAHHDAVVDMLTRLFDTFAGKGTRRGENQTKGQSEDQKWKTKFHAREPPSDGKC